MLVVGLRCTRSDSRSAAAQARLEIGRIQQRAGIVCLEGNAAVGATGDLLHKPFIDKCRSPASGDVPGIDQLEGLGRRVCMCSAGQAQKCRRSEEHTSELQSLMRISYAVFCLKKQKHTTNHKIKHT